MRTAVNQVAVGDDVDDRPRGGSSEAAWLRGREKGCWASSAAESTSGSREAVRRGIQVRIGTMEAQPGRGGNGELALLWAAPGVILQSLPYDGPWNIEQAASLSVAGAGPRSFDFNVDGVSNNSYGGRTALVPPADMVQEVRIDSASYAAAVGLTARSPWTTFWY